MNLTIYNKSLPLLAAALSDQRGIRVELGGDQAFTDGRTIHLPALSLDADEALLGAARGFLDHESAHVLFSEFAALNSSLTPFEKFCANAIEDLRVEQLMVERYPGSVKNLHETAVHVFLNKHQKTSTDPSFDVPSYILLRLRSQTCAELCAKAKEAAALVAAHFPGLLGQLEPVFDEIRQCCPDTAASIFYAKRIAAMLKSYVPPKDAHDAHANDSKDGNSGTQKSSAGSGVPGEAPKNVAATATPSLAPLFANDAEMPQTMGEALSDELNASAKQNQDEAFTTAIEVPAAFPPMSAAMRDKTIALEARLRPHLRGVLQADTFEGLAPAVQGRLNARKLYAVPLGNIHVFTRREPKRLISTAVHILLDKSGSTIGNIEDAAMSAYAVASAAQSIPGVNVGMTAFPVRYDGDIRPGVTTILKHGQRLHDFKAIDASGGTPLAEALYHLVPQLLRQREPRKMLIIFTDGRPDSPETARRALTDAAAVGLETYAISYKCPAVLSMFPEDRCIVIDRIDDLPGAFTSLLLGTLSRAA